MRLGLLGLAATALLVAPALNLLGTTEASAQRGLYKGWLAPAKYRTNEERRYTIGGGQPTGNRVMAGVANPAGAVMKKKSTHIATTQTVYTNYGPRTCGWNPGSRNPRVFLGQQARGCF